MDTDRIELIAMIRDSAAAIAPRDGPLTRIRALRFVSPGFDLQVWREMAELGWIGLRVSEEQGGVGMGMAESVALYEALGRGLVPEPLIAASLSASLLAVTDEKVLLARVIAGEALVATAWAATADAVAIPATAADRRFVAMADAAEAYLVPTGSGTDATLTLVFADEAHAATVALQDGGFAAELRAPAGVGRPLALHDTAVFARALDEAALGTAAYLLGVAEQAFAMTLGYLKERRQFGQPLAAFQALQHRCADMQIQLTLTRASIDDAAREIDGGADATTRALVVSRAKSRAADTAMLVGREAIQMHGAIGYTDEYDVGLFTRKAMTVANQYGSASAHCRRYVALAPDFAA